eukprot:Skav217025  [mRNA]  locus=scaffold1803:304188:319932:- [translate_table: standard]
MSTSLIPWSFATLADLQAQELQQLVKSVASLVHEQGSTFWTPGDLSRVAWSWAKLLQRDDTFFRRCSCLVIARLPEYTPSQLAQTVWAFATVAPADACTHLFPKAAVAMVEGDDATGLHAYTPQHLAMAVWSFAAVLYRPEELLKQMGETVPYKLEKLNPQDISTTAWAFTTLLAKDRTIYEVLAATSIRTVHEFNNQDLSNTVWAFASAGEYHADLLEAVAAETCRRADFHGQHLAMVAWAFITLRHRNDRLLHFVGEMTNSSRGLGTWSNAKLLAFSFAGLPRLGDALLGSEKWTLGAMQQLLEHFHGRLRSAQHVDADDAWVVHDAILPWLQLDSDLTATASWEALTRMLAAQRESLAGFLESEEFRTILACEKPKETSIIRRYQESIQAFRIRGLGCEHSWRFLRSLGVLRSTENVTIGNEIRSCSSKHVDGRGERQNWCYFRSRVSVNGLEVHEPGRLLNSTVVKYREDSAGLVHVKLHHDRVDHRAWDAEFRAMARTAAAARTLLKGGSRDMARQLLETGARTGDDIPCGSLPSDEARVEGELDLFMTEDRRLEAVTDRGETPLARAAARGHGAVVQLLLQAGSKMDHANCFGQKRVRVEGHGWNSGHWCLGRAGFLRSSIGAERIAAMANLANQDLYNLSLLAKSLESMLLLWEQHVNAIPDGDESEPASRLRSTANDARSSVASILEVSHLLQAGQESNSAMPSLQASNSFDAGPHSIIRLMKMLRAKKIKDIWERLEIRPLPKTVVSKMSAFAVSVASLTQTYFKISERNRGFKDEMFALPEISNLQLRHMHKLKLDDASQRKIKDYVTHLFTRRKIMAKELNFLGRLPPPLDTELRCTEASTCTLICIGKLKFAKVLGMHLSKRRQDVLTLSEKPNEIDTWMHQSRR